MTTAHIFTSIFWFTFLVTISVATGSAYALHMEERTGSLRPGKFADLVVLSDDPMEADPESLHRLEVLVTMVGGRVEHCAAEAQSLCPAFAEGG